MFSLHRCIACAMVLGLALRAWSQAPGEAGSGAKQAADPRQEEINRAIDAGVETLRKAQADNGSFAHANTLGMTALCGWALLEGGLSKKDPAMSRLVDFVRDSCLGSDHTYSISLAIIFLDRLGEPGDAPLIEAMACQLLRQEGQTGTWCYPCPEIPEAERKIFAEKARKAREEAPPPRKPKDKEKKRFSSEATRLWQQLKYENLGADASNTQFAMMALWVARRHGVPADDALRRVHAAFQKAQRGDGWAYTFDDPSTPATPAMTCAGLLSLALGHAVDKKQTNLLKEPRVEKAMGALAGFMDRMSQNKQQFFGGPEGAKNYYFLWSLERMAVVYDVKKIGTREWYRWGADLLLDQGPGGWRGEFGIADTCFAILFLKRANVAADLTQQLFNPLRKPPSR